MKITAVRQHQCYCCGETIHKGDECFALFVNPSKPGLNEFDVIYTCSKCIGQDSCQTRIKRMGGTSL